MGSSHSWPVVLPQASSTQHHPRFQYSWTHHLEKDSSRAHRLQTTFSDEALKALQDLLYRSPRDFGLATSV
jgi:hypothetical protein